MDLFTFMQEIPDKRKKQRPELDDWLYFPPNVVPTTSEFINGKKKTHPTNLSWYLNNTSCINEGFTVMSNGGKGMRKEDDTTKYFKYTVRCCGKSRLDRNNSTKKQKRETTCAKDISEKCKFEFRVYHEVSTGRMCIRASGGRNFLHTGHSFASKEHTNDSLRTLPKANRQTAVDLIEENVPTNFIKILLEVQTGRSITSDSLRQLRNTVLNEKHQKGKDETTATCLKRIMDNTDGCRYFLMTGTVDQALNRVRVHKYHTTKGKTHTQERKDANDVEDVEVEVGSDMDRYVRSVVKALTLEDGEVLIGIAWTTKEGRLSHIRFPHILGVDVTYGDNNEKRPHIRVIGKNQRNKNMPFVDGFLPSQQPYVFSWFFEDAIPALLDRQALLKTQILITDQCPIMCPTITNPLYRLKLYGSAIHRICKWHKVST